MNFVKKITVWVVYMLAISTTLLYFRTNNIAGNNRYNSYAIHDVYNYVTNNNYYNKWNTNNNYNISNNPVNSSNDSTNDQLTLPYTMAYNESISTISYDVVEETMGLALVCDI